jgi:hypothetical protein
VTRQAAVLSLSAMLIASALTLAGCGRDPTQTAAASGSSLQAAQSAASTPVGAPDASGAAVGDSADSPVVVAAATTASPATNDDLDARERSLDAREAEIEARERELERQREQISKRQSGNAAQGNESFEADADAATSGIASVTKVPSAPIVVPAGTPLAIELMANVNTRITRVGDKVDGRLASNLVVDDRMAATTGARVTGSVTEVVSGSNAIGGVPTLGLKFDSLVAENGATVPILARFQQQADSETGLDAAKIVGGAAAGAVIGHQVDKDDKGTVIGGIVGGAAGAAAAKNTGGEIKLRAGTVLNVTTETSFSIY